jgi:hypothetical protein
LLDPVNRYILIQLPLKAEEKESIVLLPEDYQPEEQRWAQATVLKVAHDVRFDLQPDEKIIIDRSMVEQITIGSTNYDVILDNYVIGITD